MQEHPRPVKKPWNTRVSLLSRKGTTVCFSLWGETRMSLWESKTACPRTPCGVPGTHLDCWFWRRAAMQRPSVWREVLMLFASFIRSPLFWSLQRSDPARSHRDNLRKRRQYSHNLLGLSCSSQVYNSDTLRSPTLLTFPASPEGHRRLFWGVWATAGQKGYP